MSRQEAKRLTLEERLALAAQSKAASPEAAAALVRQFSQLPAVYLFCTEADLTALDGLTGEFWEEPQVDVDTYQHFCPVFQMALEQDCSPILLEKAVPCQPMWGIRAGNTLVLLGEMLLDHAMGRRPHKEVYHCLHMTLGQYLEALTGPVFRRSETEEELFQAWRDKLLRDRDGEQPLAQALAGILRQYMAAWEKLSRLDHLLHCLAGLALHQEQAGTAYKVRPCPEGEASEGDASFFLEISRTEEALAASRLRIALRRFGIGRDPEDLPQADRDCQDPQSYFLDLARAYDPNLPDPGGDLPPAALREQIFLPRWRYGPDVLRELAKELPFPEFVPLMEECLRRDLLDGAMREINAAVTDLYMLWVEPYLCMEEETPAGNPANLF